MAGIPFQKDRRTKWMMMLFLAFAVLLCFGKASAEEQPPGAAATPRQAADKVPALKKGVKPAAVITEQVVTALRLVPFPKVQRPDSTMPRGVIKVLQQGREGRERVTYRIRMANGQILEKTVLGAKVISQPRPHIELVGTAPRISHRTVTEVRSLPFRTEQKTDASLPAGTVKAIQEGREGQEKITYRLTITDGKETERVVTGSEILSKPVDRMEAVGTGNPPQPPSTPPPSPVKEAK